MSNAAAIWLGGTSPKISFEEASAGFVISAFCTFLPARASVFLASSGEFAGLLLATDGIAGRYENCSSI